MLRSLFIGLSESKRLRHFAEHSAMGLRFSSRFVAGTQVEDVQAHMRELEADVGVQLARGDIVQQAVIQFAAVPGFVGVGDVLAQVVDADAGAPLVHGLRGAKDVLDLGACDKAAGEAQPHRRVFGKMA